MVLKGFDAERLHGVVAVVFGGCVGLMSMEVRVCHCLGLVVDQLLFWVIF